MSYSKKPTSEEIKKEIIRDYNGDREWSYGGVDQIYRSFKGLITKRGISDALSEIDVYTSYRRRKPPKNFSPIYVYKQRELWQMDTVFFTNADMVKANDGNGFLLTIIDCFRYVIIISGEFTHYFDITIFIFSKMGWCVPMKNANCDNAMKIFGAVIEKARKPEKLNTDRGSELVCRKFENFLKKKKIRHYLSFSLRKCPIVERFNLTIQNLLYRMMSANHSYKWTSFLENALKIYRTRRHRTIKMSPEMADKPENEDLVRANLLEFFHDRGIKRNKPKFSINDTVRISRHRNTFHRGYNQENTEEYFIITKVDNSLPGEVRYQIKDSSNEVIVGSYFENELVKYKPSEYFDIQVIDEKGKGRSKKYYISYVGYPKKFNEWVSEGKLKKLQ